MRCMVMAFFLNIICSASFVLCFCLHVGNTFAKKETLLHNILGQLATKVSLRNTTVWPMHVHFYKCPSVFTDLHINLVNIIQFIMPSSCRKSYDDIRILPGIRRFLPGKSRLFETNQNNRGYIPVITGLERFISSLPDVTTVDARLTYIHCFWEP